MSAQSQKEMEEQLGRLPTLFKLIGSTLSNKCQCQTCISLRAELIKMAKIHEMEQVILAKNSDVP